MHKTSDSLLTAIIYSCYSKRFYRQAASSWQGKIFAYLFVLLLIVWIYTVFFIAMFVNKSLPHYLQNITAQVPTITIKDGNLSVAAKTPYIIKHDNQAIIILDPNNQFYNFTDSTAFLLINNNSIAIKSIDNMVEFYTIPAGLNIEFSPQLIANLPTKVNHIFIITCISILFTFGLALSYGIFVLISLFNLLYYYFCLYFIFIMQLKLYKILGGIYEFRTFEIAIY